MTESLNRPSFPADKQTPPSEFPWIARFTLAFAATCGVVVISAIVLKSEPNVQAEISLNAASPSSTPATSSRSIWRLPRWGKIPVNPASPSQNKYFSTQKTPQKYLSLPPKKNLDNHSKTVAISENAELQKEPLNQNANFSPLTPQVIEKVPQEAPQNSVFSPAQVEIITQNQPSIETSPISPANSSETESVPSTVQPELTPEEAGVELSLSEVIFLSLENNRDIRNQYLERIAQRQDLAVAEGKFIPTFTPRLSVSGLRFRTGGDRTLTDGLDLSAQVSMTLPTGGQLSFGWLGDRQGVDQNGFVRNGDNFLNQRLQLEFNQPLLRGAGLALNRASIEIARLNERSNFLVLKSTLIDTITTSIFAYRDLLKAQEEVIIARSALQSTRRQLEINQGLVEAGRLARVELLSSEKLVADQEFNLLGTESRLKQSRLALLQILDIDQALNIIAVESPLPEFQPLDYNNILQVALGNRGDYLRTLLNREINQYNLRIAENNRRWQLDFNATYNSYGIGFESQSDLRAGLVLTRQLGNREIERDFQRARVNLLQSENTVKELNQRLEIEVANALREVNLSLRQLELTRRARELAERQLEIEQDKLRLGVRNTRILDIVEFQERLVTARNAELNARIDYLNSLTNLDRILGTTLETWQIEIEEQRQNPRDAIQE